MELNTTASVQPAGVEARLAALEVKIDEVAKITKRLYRVFFWTGMLTVATIVLPMILFVFALPQLMAGLSAHTGNLSGISGL